MIVKCTVLCYYCLQKTRKPKQPEHICRTGKSSASANRDFKTFQIPGKLWLSGDLSVAEFVRSMWWERIVALEWAEIKGECP